MPETTERTEEYRVVGDPDRAAARHCIAGPFLNLTSAQEALERFNPIGFDVVYRNVRIQKSETIRTPWVDIDEGEGGDA